MDSWEKAELLQTNYGGGGSFLISGRPYLVPFSPGTGVLGATVGNVSIITVYLPTDSNGFLSPELLTTKIFPPIPSSATFSITPLDLPGARPSTTLLGLLHIMYSITAISGCSGRSTDVSDPPCATCTPHSRF